MLTNFFSFSHFLIFSPFFLIFFFHSQIDTSKDGRFTVSELHKEEEEELLEYLRQFSKEWGHPTYGELQNFVGYQKTPTRRDSFGTSSEKRTSSGMKSRRRRSLALF